LIINSCEKKEKGTVEIIVGFTSEEFQSAINKVFMRSKNHISVPGFRKGKAPRKIIEKMLGANIFHKDALDMLLPDAIDDVRLEHNLKFLENPSITNVDIKDGDGGVEVTVDVTCYPDVTLGEYKGLAALKPSVEVLDSEVDMSIEKIRDRNASMENVDRPVAVGDIVYIDFVGYVDGEPIDDGEGDNFELTIGSNTLIPGFEDGLVGMSAGDERVVELVFPEEYDRNPDVAGKPVTFNVRLNDVKEKTLPDLDDEFAKDVSEFDTLEEYRADIREEKLIERQKYSNTEFENNLLKKIVDFVEVDVPDILVERQIDKAVNAFMRQVSSYGIDMGQYLLNMGMTLEDFRDDRREDSLKQVKIALALEKIAELEGIEASPREIESEYEKAARSLSTDVEDIRDRVDEEIIISEIKKRLALQFVVDNAKAINSEQEQEETPVSEDDIIQEHKEAPISEEVAEEELEESPDIEGIKNEEQKETITTSDITSTPQDGKTATVRRRAARKSVSKKTKGEEEI